MQFSASTTLFHLFLSISKKASGDYHKGGNKTEESAKK